MRRSFLSAALLGVCLALPALAEEVPSWEVEDCKRQAEWIQGQVGWMQGDYARHGDFTKIDLELMEKAHQQVIAAWEKAIATYAKGDLAEARALKKEAQKLHDASGLWRHRLDRRAYQAQVAPSERWLAKEVLPWCQPEARAELDAWVEAKQRAAEAWGRAAEAITPEADPERLAELDDQAYAARIEEEVASWRFEWRNQRLRALAYGKHLITPAVMRTVREAEQIEEQRIAHRRGDIERDRRTRQLERLRKQSERELQQALEAERQAREEAKRREREEAERKEAERRARAEAERQAREEAKRQKEK